MRRGTIRNVEAYKCPRCGEEVFTGDQVDHIQKRVRELLPQPRIARKITRVAKKPAIYFPKAGRCHPRSLYLVEDILVIPVGSSDGRKSSGLERRAFSS